MADPEALAAARVTRDIATVSYDMLLAAREAFLVDEAAASIRFGIDAEHGRKLAAMPIGTLRRLADAGVIAFRPNIPPHLFDRVDELTDAEIATIAFSTSLAGEAGSRKTRP